MARHRSPRQGPGCARALEADKTVAEGLEAPRPPARMGWRWILCLLVAVLSVGGCDCRGGKSDAERATEERARLQARLSDSLTLVPYRGLKLSVRSTGSAARPAELAKVGEALEAAQQVPTRLDDPAARKQAVQAWTGLALGFFALREALEKYDEDQFPLLWTVATQKPVPAEWYGKEAEHLILASFWVAVHEAAKSSLSPGLDFALYELSRGPVKPDMPFMLQAWGYGARGASYCAGGYHYAAEEELSAYLGVVDQATPEQLQFLTSPEATPERTRDTLRAAGYFLRAWNRLGLGREPEATQDMQQALASLERLKIENEATYWAWAWLHYRNGRLEDAGKSLDKLAASPHLDEATRAEVAETARSLKGMGNQAGVLDRAAGLRILTMAMVSRAGGLETITQSLLGEGGQQLSTHWGWLQRTANGMGTDVDLKRTVDDARGMTAQTLEQAMKGLSVLRQKAGELTGDKPLQTLEEKARALKDGADLKPLGEQARGLQDKASQLLKSMPTPPPATPAPSPAPSGHSSLHDLFD